MLHIKRVLALLALAVVLTQAKPSHPSAFHGVFDHLDLVPPVLPPAHFHGGEPAPGLPYHHHAKLLPPAHFHANHFLPAPAPLLPAPVPFIPGPEPLVPAIDLPAPAPLLPVPAPLYPAPAPLIPAPAPLLPAHAHLLPAPASFVPAPAPILPAPVVHAETHFIPAAAPVVTPFLEALPVVEPIPSYRVIPGPKTTTHHVSVGYAFPQSRLAKLHAHVHAVPHAHLHAASLAWPRHHHHHHHHTLF